MSDDLRLVEQAVQGAGGPRLWDDVLAAFYNVIAAPFTPQAEQLLLSLLRFDGRLDLDPDSEIPHSLSPEDMLKSLAVQALGNWTGQTYAPAMRRLQIKAAANSPALASVIEAVLRRTAAVKKPEPDLEPVAETRGVEGGSFQPGPRDASSPAEFRWSVGVSDDEEYSAFCAGQTCGIVDEEGRLYGALRTPDGNLRDLGIWHQQVALFARGGAEKAWTGLPISPINDASFATRPGQKALPPKEVLMKMQSAGVLTPLQRKRLARGSHA